MPHYILECPRYPSTVLQEHLPLFWPEDSATQGMQAENTDGMFMCMRHTHAVRQRPWGKHLSENSVHLLQQK